MIFNQRISILRAGKKQSPYSTKPVADWGNPIVIPVDFFVSIQPQSTSEGPLERPKVEASWRMYTPPGTDLDLRCVDRVGLSGMLDMNVVGKTSKWPEPFNPGAVHHVEASLEVVDG